MRLFKEGFIKSTWWLRCAMPYARWIEPQASPTVYLTFDDGPVSGVTESVLETLGQFQATATFFCVGMAAQKEPQLIRKILDAGHQIGNHSYSHCNGWVTPTETYIADIHQGKNLLEQLSQRPVRLFRPPFGRISLRQWRRLRNEMETCMWDVTSQDFLSNRSADQVADIVVTNARNGSIVLMHDSDLAAPRMLTALPRILRSLTDSGFVFRPLPERGRSQSAVIFNSF